MTYSFSRILKLPGRPASPNATLDFDDLPQMFADRYKVHNLEIQHGHFLSTEPSYFKDFLARLAKTKSRVTNINLELGTMNISVAGSRTAGAGGRSDAGVDRPRGDAGVSARDDQPGAR